MSPQRLSFEFDPAKAASNLKKHGVDFLEAITVFNDPLSSTPIAQPQHHKLKPWLRPIHRFRLNC